MDHDVLHIGEFPFNGAVDPFGDPVGIDQRNIRFHCDFQIHIDFVSKLPCMQQVDPFNAVLCADKGAQTLLKLVIAGSIKHFADSITGDFKSDFENQCADDQACDGIHDRETQLGHPDADKRSDGGDRVRTMMPGIRLESG